MKIRGFRIELGEIEAQLARHAAVKEAAVVVREDRPGEKRLVAYVTLRTLHRAPSNDELRVQLKSVLPEYMVPSIFVTLEALPLTPSGKLNRRALPVPEAGSGASDQYQAPQGTVEQELARIWQEVLGATRVGRHDHFFEIGGHSLLALKALLRVNQSLGCSLRVSDLYTNPTIRELAARIAGETSADALVDLAVEAELDPAIVPANGLPHQSGAGRCCSPARPVSSGVSCWCACSQDTAAKIYCLVRARTQRVAEARLRATLDEWDLWRAEFEDRIVALPGDLRLPGLGLNELDWQLLAGEVDSIYHCATSMNHLETYAMAKAANVDSSRELLKLATRTRPKLLNYISTLGVFGATPTQAARVVDERTPIEHETYCHSQGYLASKWVAEKIFMSALARGIPCNIFRLGLVWADAQLGRFDELQSVYRVLKTCLLSGYGIENFQISDATDASGLRGASRCVPGQASQRGRRYLAHLIAQPVDRRGVRALQRHFVDGSQAAAVLRLDLRDQAPAPRRQFVAGRAVTRVCVRPRPRGVSKSHEQRPLGCARSVRREPHPAGARAGRDRRAGPE